MTVVRMRAVYIAQRPLMDELAYRPTLDETTAAIKKLSSGKAAGPDATAADIYRESVHCSQYSHASVQRAPL